MNNECGQGTWYSLPYDGDSAARAEARQLAEDLVSSRRPANSGYWWIRQYWTGSVPPSTTGLDGTHSQLVDEHYFYDPLDISIAFYSLPQ
jgi:hypothetical protein